MIRVDTQDDLPIYRQLVESIRYEIASGVYAPSEVMPATRALARELDVSFHTIRRAYGILVEEGVLASQPGKGFVVVGPAALGKSERMELGARIVSGALQRMTGIGLDDSEIAYLMEEQRSLLDFDQRGKRVVVAAEYQELAEAALEVASLMTGNIVEIMDLESIDARLEADVILVPMSRLASTKSQNARAEVLGFQHAFAEESLMAISALMDRETLGLITRYPDAIGPVSQQIRLLTGFKGQILATAVSGHDIQVDTIAAASDLVIYTKGASRTVRRVGPDSWHALMELDIHLTTSSVERVRNLFR